MLKELKFSINKMQQEALKHRGSNIVLNAPTGCGKTEAFLLNLNEKESATLMLPTVTSCVFMYKRLCEDFKDITVKIRTSITDGIRLSSTPDTSPKITIKCPDPALIEFLKNKRDGEVIDTINTDCLILDELDNYPSMVKRALLEYMREFPLKHYIIASATLDGGLLEEIKSLGCKEIEYKKDLKLIKFKTDIIDNYCDIPSIIKNNKQKRIGIICNSIKDMDDISSYIDSEYLYHHANLDTYTRLENKEKLFTQNYNVVLSNDLISFSVDIDFDILIMQLSDSMSVNIQRIGRCNRRNKKVYHKNLYLIDPALGYELPFISSGGQYNCLQYFENLMTFRYVDRLRGDLETNPIPSLDYIWEYWESLDKVGTGYNLRRVPLTFEYDTTIYKYVYNKDTKQKEEVKIETTGLLKWNKEDFPWSWYPCSKEGGDRDIVHLFGNNYIIVRVGRTIKIRLYLEDSFEYEPEEEKRHPVEKQNMKEAIRSGDLEEWQIAYSKLTECYCHKPSYVRMRLEDYVKDLDFLEQYSGHLLKIVIGDYKNVQNKLELVRTSGVLDLGREHILPLLKLLTILAVKNKNTTALEMLISYKMSRNYEEIFYTFYKSGGNWNSSSNIPTLKWVNCYTFTEGQVGYMTNVYNRLYHPEGFWVRGDFYYKDRWKGTVKLNSKSEETLLFTNKEDVMKYLQNKRGYSVLSPLDLIFPNAYYHYYSIYRINSKYECVYLKKEDLAEYEETNKMDLF